MIQKKRLLGIIVLLFLITIVTVTAESFADKNMYFKTFYPSINEIDNADNKIEIISAEHLDAEKNFIENIYDDVYLRDDSYSNLIKEDEYIRIVFENELVSTNDITIYPRIISGNPIIEVYEKDSDIIIGRFENLKDNHYNAIFLNNLLSEEQDTFYLQIIGGEIILDHIIDPITVVNYTASGTFTVPAGVTSITVEAWGAGGAGGGGAGSGGARHGGGGGAGGQYVVRNISVAESQEFTITIAPTTVGTTSAGSSGSNTTFTNSTATYVRAVGGAGGALASTGGAAGGTGSTANYIGDSVFAGGNGADGLAGSSSGGGGGGAGNTGTGGAASGTTGGSGTANNPDGTGGAGLGGNGAGSPGVLAGGGGGGGRTVGNAGGDGAAGYLRVTYEIASSPPDAPTGVLATDGTHTDRVTVTWTKSSGATAYYLFTTESGLLASLGDVDEYNHTSSPAPTITPGTASASDGTNENHVALSLSGQSANIGATRTYYVVASNEAGNSTNSGTNTGYRGVGALSYQWERSAADSDASYSTLSGATTTTFNDTTAPIDGSGRYYRVVLNAAGASQQITTANRGYRSVDETPSYNNFTGTTTNFSAVGNLSAVSEPILEIPTFGRIRWYGTVNARNQNFDAYVIISDNNITVQSANLHSSFNSSAEIIFYGLPYSETPILLKDGVECSNPVCNITSYSAGTLIANVSSFSEFSTMDQPPEQIEQVWTVSAWVNIADISATQYLLNGLNLGLFLVNGSTDRMLMYLNSGSSDYYAYTASGLLTGQGWKHVAFVFRNVDGYRKIYVDGVDQTILGPNVNNSPYGVSSTLQVGTNAVGTIDEIMIFKRALEEQEIRAIYDASTYRLETNISGLDTGTYEYRAYSTDEAGNYNQTEIRILNIELDSDPPYWDNNITNETDSTPRLNENIQMNLSLYDDGDLNSYIFSWNGTGSWINDSKQIISGLEHNLSVTKATTLTRGNRIGWKVYFNDSTSKTNITDIFLITVKNTRPDAPVLDYPNDGDDLFINRTPTFNWTGTDPDSDVLTYNIEVALDSGFSTIIVNETGLSTNQYFQGVPLDLDTVYYWRVIANDSLNLSDYSIIFNFTIVPYVNIELDNADVDFGTLRINDINDTTTNNPTPIIVRNAGNIDANISLNASTFWTTENVGTQYYQFKARSFQNNAFETSTSLLVFTNVSSTKLHTISRLNWIGNTSAYVDLRVLVPSAEPPGAKNSTIYMTAVVS